MRSFIRKFTQQVSESVTWIITIVLISIYSFGIIGDTLNWSEDIAYFADKLLYNQHEYRQCYNMGHRINFVGPKKKYKFDKDEKRIFQEAGFDIDDQKGAWLFKHAIVKGAK